MQLAPDRILEAALGLSDRERLDLVARILDSVPAETDLLSVNDPKLPSELGRRFSDGAPAIPWSEIRGRE
jgi:hypothetical protein